MSNDLSQNQLKFDFNSEKYYKYVFQKDFGGRLGICYKEPVVKGHLTDRQIKDYTDYGYQLIKIIEIKGVLKQ